MRIIVRGARLLARRSVHRRFARGAGRIARVLRVSAAGSEAEMGSSSGLRDRALQTKLAARLRPAALALAALGIGLSLSGCGSLPRNAVPAEQSAQATVPGLPDIRAWGGLPSAPLSRDLAASFAQESEADFPRSADGSVRYPHLALSGGGASGAFGAGFLNGWSSSGTRPVFKTVTGVSTGALMAPFAFLGPAYDDALREFYTTTRTRDIFVLGSIVRQLLTGEALADTGPLVALIERHVDAELLRRVADAHQGGRRIYVGTVDLDARRFVVWNMGLIAVSGRPGALELFRKVMLASASIPVAFPPVLFAVEAGGRLYDEMHVDGGVGARVFLNAGVFGRSPFRDRGGLGVGHEDIFVIHNGQLIPPPDAVRRSLPAIATRVIDASGRAAVLGDLHRINAYAQREGASFQWVTVPDGVVMDADEVFDPAKMRELYDLGYRIGATPEPWSTRAPGRGRETEP
jgi:Patatin-like phospholipase